MEPSVHLHIVKAKLTMVIKTKNQERKASDTDFFTYRQLFTHQRGVCIMYATRM